MLKWHYDGTGAPLSEITAWCKEHFGNDYFGRRWNLVYQTIHFNHEKDYTMFLLKWS